MKRNLFLVGLALGTAVTLVGCSQSSPTAPKVPTPAASAVSLTASPSVAGINEGILLVAMVSAGSGNAPDGTAVTFTTTIGFFVENGLAIGTTETRTTSGGRATATLVSTAGGDGVVTARVGSGSASTPVHFRGVAASQVAITSVLPNRGKVQGGDQVTISGQGFATPLTVNFIVSGTSYPATVTAVAADGSSITALTPQVPTSSGDQLASIQVTLTSVVAPGGGPVSATLSNAFTYTSVSDAGIPQLFSVVPNSGSSNGGEIITLTGKYFTEPLQVSFVFAAATVPGQVTSVQHGADGVDVAQVVTPKVTIAGRTTVNITITNMVGSPSSKSATFNQVFTFTPPVTGPPVIYYISPTYGSVAGNDTVTIYGANFAAPASVSIGPTSEIVQSISTDGTMITILTRPVAGVVPTDPQDVTVTTAQGTVTLSKAFTYLEGQTPTLYVLTPNIGPVEGGTRVTITGTGFQYPVQVLFGTQQAQVVSNNYNQVVCISPSITPTQPNTPTTVQVSVTNVGSGKTSNGLPFQYGQSMFISAIAPGTGPDTGGTTVSIMGQGFVGPLAVSLAGTPAQVLSVAGTQIVVKSGAVQQRSCSYKAGDVVVTNIDSNLSATGSLLWTYTAMNPLITSVTASGGTASGNTAPQTGSACAADGSVTVTIKGSGFEQFMQVGLTGGGYTFNIPASFDNANQLHFTLPDLFGFAFKTVPVATATCASGSQNVPTGMDVTVTNIATTCFNTLTGGLIINPCVSCTPAPPVTPTVITLTPNPLTISLAGGASQNLTISLNQPAPIGGATVTLVSATPAVATVTPSVFFSAGTTTATAVVTGISTGTTQITATSSAVLNSATTTSTVTVTP